MTRRGSIIMHAQHVLLFCMLLLMFACNPPMIQASCNLGCNGHGYCGAYDMCICMRRSDGDVAFTGADCSLRTCPKATAWVGAVVGSNDVHPVVECSNKGTCDRETGTCMCYDNYTGLACERTVCPDDCSGRGECYTARQLASEAGAVYKTPWDSDKNVGCVCDAGYRGFNCGLKECPSGPDLMKGFGNEAGRECSGRGICEYRTGKCGCFAGFYGHRCEKQTTTLFF